MEPTVNPFTVLELALGLKVSGFDFHSFDPSVQRGINCRKTGEDLAGNRTVYNNYAASKFDSFKTTACKMAVAMWPDADLIAIHSFMTMFTHSSTIQALQSFCSPEVTPEDVNWALGDFVETTPEGEREQRLQSALKTLIVLTAQRIASVWASEVPFKNPFGSLVATSPSIKDYITGSILPIPRRSSKDYIEFHFPEVTTGVSTTHPGLIITERDLVMETPTTLPDWNNFVQFKIIEVIRSGELEVPIPELLGVSGKAFAFKREDCDRIASPGDRFVTMVLSELSRLLVDERVKPEIGISQANMVNSSKSNLTYATVRDVGKAHSRPVAQHLLGTELESLSLTIDALDGQRKAVLYVVCIFYQVLRTIEAAWTEWRRKMKFALARPIDLSETVSNASETTDPASTTTTPPASSPATNFRCDPSGRQMRKLPVHPPSSHLPPRNPEAIPTPRTTSGPAAPQKMDTNNPVASSSTSESQNNHSRKRTKLVYAEPAQGSLPSVGRSRSSSDSTRQRSNKKGKGKSAPMTAEDALINALSTISAISPSLSTKSIPKNPEREVQGPTGPRDLPRVQNLPAAFAFSFTIPSPATNTQFTPGMPVSFSITMSPAATTQVVEQRDKPKESVPEKEDWKGTQFELDVRDALREVRASLRLRAAAGRSQPSAPVASSSAGEN